MIGTEPGKQINIKLSIEEIILIKECLFESEQKQIEFEKDTRNNIAIRGVAQRKAVSLKNLTDKLAVYGYGYQED